MLGRESGLGKIDFSSSGFWLSFYGLAFAGLIDASAYSLKFETTPFVHQPTKAWFVLGSLIIVLIGYGASFLTLYLLCRNPEEQQNFSRTITTNNWASAIASVLTLPLVLLSTMTISTNEVWGIIPILLLGVMIFIGTNLLRLSLQISRVRAFAYFAATTIVSLICVEGLGEFAGFSLRTLSTS